MKVTLRFKADCTIHPWLIEMVLTKKVSIPIGDGEKDWRTYMSFQLSMRSNTDGHHKHCHMPCQGPAGLSGKIQYLLWAEKMQKVRTHEAPTKSLAKKKEKIFQEQPLELMPTFQTSTVQRDRTVTSKCGQNRTSWTDMSSSRSKVKTSKAWREEIWCHGCVSTDYPVI